MENGSLSDIIEQFGVFPEPLVATYLFQVLTGLQFLHSHNVIHKVSHFEFQISNFRT